MKRRTLLFSSVVAFALSVPPFSKPVLAEDPRASQKLSEDSESLETLSQAADSYKAIVKGSHGALPVQVAAKAGCVAIFPGVITAAVGVGGIHGDGVLFCRRSNSEWGNPVFLDLTGASVGAQIGVKSSDLVLFITGDKAKSAMERGDFTVSGELSAVAGNFSETFSAPNEGIVAYSRTSGAFAGASLSGIDLTIDQDEHQKFYGTKFEKGETISSSVPKSAALPVAELKKLLPA